ncbi:MAG: ImmA/IrrE family metallo-endopeptidase [Alphaproteobacteria bacterium]|nr:ImmA/IrrE family metallo-endopeptidase [Alphaproteobacteria bacterium]
MSRSPSAIHADDGESVVPVPPMSRMDIIGVATATLGVLQPKRLERPGPVDVLRLIDHQLPARGVDVYPAAPKDLPGCEALTIPLGARPTVLMRGDQWRYLLQGGPRGLRARATVAHELGHVALHVPFMRRQARDRALPLTRVNRRALRAYHDPEWQAWCFAGAFLVPPHMVLSVSRGGVAAVAETFQVSRRFAHWYLRVFSGVLTSLDQELCDAHRA